MKGRKRPTRFVVCVLTTLLVLGLFNISILTRTLPINNSFWTLASLPSHSEFRRSQQHDSRQLEFMGPDASTSRVRKFFILHALEMSTWLVGNHTRAAIKFYESCLNEEAIEIWLHRGFERLSSARTMDEDAATAYLIPYYGHFAIDLHTKPDPNDFAKMLLRSKILNKSKPHILLCPSNNPQRSRHAGIRTLMDTLHAGGVNVWSVGIERNPSWQGVAVERIIPIPYLVKSAGSFIEMRDQAVFERKNASIFYAGDERKNAFRWSGCNRSMVEPLRSAPNMVIKLIHSGDERLSQSRYNKLMQKMEFCLILCGDTPTSRSLATAMVFGCIPLMIGSRLRGLCDKPCKRGFGWSVTGPQAPHLPYMDSIPWGEFPEVNEAEFINKPEVTLRTVVDSYTDESKKKLRDILARVQLGWIYGWGSPVTSGDFGEAAAYTWNSILFFLDTTGSTIY
jgi:Exostosin family